MEQESENGEECIGGRQHKCQRKATAILEQLPSATTHTKMAGKREAEDMELPTSDRRQKSEARSNKDKQGCDSNRETPGPNTSRPRHYDAADTAYATAIEIRSPSDRSRNEDLGQLLTFQSGGAGGPTYLYVKIVGDEASWQPRQGSEYPSFVIEVAVSEEESHLEDKASKIFQGTDGGVRWIASRTRKIRGSWGTSLPKFQQQGITQFIPSATSFDIALMLAEASKLALNATGRDLTDDGLGRVRKTPFRKGFVPNQTTEKKIADPKPDFA
ncbi:MAG: hypothetical protein LQ338_007718 [Usnochroma carphineum]|nr:MAG: hypothetical protein LQ338_007718 [Usnochroma carphineum]